MTTVPRARIADRIPARQRLAHPPRFGVKDRLNVVARLLGPKGILPDTRLGIILSQPDAREHHLSEIIRDILTFDRQRHQATSDIITEIVREVEALPKAEIFSGAQLVVDRLYQEKIARNKHTGIQADFPIGPTVDVFARLSPNGHFDPYQYFSSEGWGAIKIRLDYGKTIGYEKALTNFDLRQKLRDVLLLTRAFEYIS